MKETIGKRIHDKRKEIKMTMEKLAEYTGVTKQTIYKYENDIISNIPADKVEKIAIALNVSPMYLIGWEKINDNKVKTALSKKVGEKIRKERLNKGMTINDLAKLLNISDIELINIENGNDYGYDNYIMISICNILDLPFSFFYDSIKPVDDIGSNLKCLREALGLSVAKLCSLTGISDDQYKKYEDNKANVMYTDFDKLSNLYHIDVSMILSTDFSKIENITYIKLLNAINSADLDADLSYEEMKELTNYVRYLVSKR